MEHEISDLARKALQGTIAFETLESLVKTTALRIGAEILEEMINSAQASINKTIKLSDETVASYAGKQEKTFVTLVGDITLSRAYYIDGNGNGYFPQDEQMGFDKDSLSSCRCPF
jgi:hypothetical protein